MISHLDRVRDWAPLAEAARYRSNELARHCSVSLRQLERYFANRLGISPRDWLDQHRMLEAAERLQKGDYVKTVAGDLYFKDAPHFCRWFKRHFGLSPLSFVARQKTKVSRLSNQCRVPTIQSAWSVSKAATKSPPRGPRGSVRLQQR